METWDQIPALSRVPALGSQSRVQISAGGSDPPEMAEQLRHLGGDVDRSPPKPGPGRALARLDPFTRDLCLAKNPAGWDELTVQTWGVLMALEGRGDGVVTKQRAPELPPALAVGTAGQGCASVSPTPNGAAVGAAGSSQPFLSSCNPPRPLNTGVTCSWSQRWWMLGGNHGNCQVSVSLPLTVTLRCHHVPVTSRAPASCLSAPTAGPRAAPACVAEGRGGSIAAPGITFPTPAQGTDPGVPTLPRLCWGSRGSPRPGGRDPAPWGEEGSPVPLRPQRWQHPCPAAPAEGAP